MNVPIVILFNAKLTRHYVEILAESAYEHLSKKDLPPSKHNLKEVIRRSPQTFRETVNRKISDWEQDLSERELLCLAKAAVGADDKETWKASLAPFKRALLQYFNKTRKD